MASRYKEVYEGWKSDPEGFWAKAAENIDWCGCHMQHLLQLP
jgi:propionyl-CoA synthetase